jgi:hypothetical protein
MYGTYQTTICIEFTCHTVSVDGDKIAGFQMSRLSTMGRAKVHAVTDNNAAMRWLGLNIMMNANTGAGEIGD